MSRTVLIMCAGQGSRWTESLGPARKQLVPVPGLHGQEMPLLRRTMMQVLGRHDASPPVVVTEAMELTDVAESAAVFTPDNVEYWSDSVLGTRILWEGRVLCLFGDVFYTERAMDEIFASDGLAFFGRREQSGLTLGPSEIFACAWDPEHGHSVTAALEVTSAHARNFGAPRDAQGCPVGSPWQTYRTLVGAPLEQYAYPVACRVWREINDYTDDFDDLERYQAWRALYLRRFVCQDERHDPCPTGMAPECLQ